MIKQPIPKDLNKIQSKVFLNLTKRQVFCFGPAVLIGVPLFFVARSAIGNTAAVIIMIIVMLPFFLMAMYEHNDEHLETYLKHLIETRFRRKKYRPYVTNNLYDCLKRQNQLMKEVQAIVQKK